MRENLNYLKNMLIFKDLLSSFYKLLRRFSIRNRLFLSFLFIIILLIFSVNFLIINYQKKSLKKQYYQGLKHNLEIFSLELVDGLHINLPIFKEDFYLGAVRVRVSEVELEEFINQSIKTLKNYIIFISGIFLVMKIFIGD